MARNTSRLGAGIVVGGLLALGASVASREIVRRAGTRLIDWRAVRRIAEQRLGEAGAPLDVPAVVDRLQWVDLNVATFRVLFDRIETTLLEQQSGPDTAGRAMSRWVNRTVSNQQLGFMLAFLARKVLGQYDVSLLAAGPEVRGRLHFVEPNILGTAAALRLPRDEF